MFIYLDTKDEYGTYIVYIENEKIEYRRIARVIKPVITPEMLQSVTLKHTPTVQDIQKLYDCLDEVNKNRVKVFIIETLLQKNPSISKELVL